MRIVPETVVWVHFTLWLTPLAGQTTFRCFVTDHQEVRLCRWVCTSTWKYNMLKSQVWAVSRYSSYAVGSASDKSGFDSRQRRKVSSSQCPDWGQPSLLSNGYCNRSSAWSHGRPGFEPRAPLYAPAYLHVRATLSLFKHVQGCTSPENGAAQTLGLPRGRHKDRRRAPTRRSDTK
jgi:hypothetical protein